MITENLRFPGQDYFSLGYTSPYLLVKTKEKGKKKIINKNICDQLKKWYLLIKIANEINKLQEKTYKIKKAY